MDLQTFNDEFLPSSLIGLSVVKIVKNQFILTGIRYFNGHTDLIPLFTVRFEGQKSNSVGMTHTV